MQKAELILVKLNQKSKSNKTFKFKRLYRNLYNPDFHLYGYSKIYTREGNMTQGADGRTIDGFNMKWITETIIQLRDERYYPTPVRRVFIPKKNGKTRPLGIPTFKDKLIQEIIREILEAIYEPLFSKNSHGFRPNRSCHTALFQIKRTGTGAAWAIEGDIQSFFDTIDHDILLSILKRKIDDGRFLELIRRFLKAGYVKDGITYNTISGTPQGGIVSPILANIYLHELDTYMETIIDNYTKGEKRKENHEYKRIRNNIFYKMKTGKIQEAKVMTKQMRKLPSKATMDPDYVRIRYVRYADDFLIYIIGPLALAKQIRDKTAKFLKDKLQLKLNMEKTLITNMLKDKVKFLGYEIHKAKENSQIIKDSIGRRRRRINGIIQLSVPRKIIDNKIKEFTRDGKPIHRKDRLNLKTIQILLKYNAEIRGLYNYYRLASNVGKRLHKFKYYHYFSLLKTIGRKEKISITDIIGKYGISVPRKSGTGTIKIFGLQYTTKQGEKILTYFNKSLKRIDKPIRYEIANHSSINNITYCELITRLNRGKCEICNTEHTPQSVVVHHIRNLKNLENHKESYWISLMKKLRRKTLIVCPECHDRIHNS